MEAEAYVTASKDKGLIKMSKRRPSTRSDEIAFKIKVNIPDEVFERVVQEVNVKIDPNAIPKEPEILSTIDQIEL